MLSNLRIDEEGGPGRDARAAHRHTNTQKKKKKKKRGNLCHAYALSAGVCFAFSGTCCLCSRTERQRSGLALPPVSAPSSSSPSSFTAATRRSEQRPEKSSWPACAFTAISCHDSSREATCGSVPTCDRGSSSQLQISVSASPLAFLQTLLRYRARLRCVRWHVTQRHAVNVCPVEARADKSVSCGGQRGGCCCSLSSFPPAGPPPRLPAPRFSLTTFNGARALQSTPLLHRSRRASDTPLASNVGRRTRSRLAHVYPGVKRNKTESMPHISTAWSTSQYKYQQSI